MRGGVILIALALLIGYLGVTGRYTCFAVFFSCIANPCGYTPGGCGTGESAPGGAGRVMVPGNSGVNPTGAPIYDATTPRIQPLSYLQPIEALL